MAERVSIVIPCYNQAHFLGEAVESALSQAYRPLEVIVVDDGATDSTTEVASTYAGARVVRQRNQGLSAARNAGLRASHGEFVVFLDADDRLLPEAVETGAAALRSRPEAGFAVGRHGRIAVDGVPLPPPRRRRVERDHYASLVRRCWIAMPATVMYRRHVLIAVNGFDPRFRHAEDYDLYLRIARRFPIVDHYTEVAEYRQHAGTLSRNADRMLAATLAVLAPHRPSAAASPALHSAWRARENAVWYYDRLLEAVREDVARGAWLSAARRLLIFARYVPQHPQYARRGLLAPLRLARRALRRPTAA